MQELMSRHKAYALSPRDCLKTTLFQKWQRMVAPPGNLVSNLLAFLLLDSTSQLALGLDCLIHVFKLFKTVKTFYLNYY